MIPWRRPLSRGAHRLPEYIGALSDINLYRNLRSSDPFDAVMTREAARLTIEGRDDRMIPHLQLYNMS